MKKLLCIFMAALLLCGLFAGCNREGEETLPATVPEPTEPVTKEFAKNGLTITLPQEFIDYTNHPVGEGFTFLYAGPYNGVSGMEDSKASLPESVTDLASYAAYQAEKKGCEAVQKDNFWTITYVDSVTYPEDQTYLCTFYESEDSFWTVSAYCPSDVYTAYQEAMWGYVTAATFENN